MLSKRFLISLKLLKMFAAAFYTCLNDAVHYRYLDIFRTFIISLLKALHKKLTAKELKAQKDLKTAFHAQK